MIKSRIRNKTQKGKIGAETGGFRVSLLGMLRSPSKGNPPPPSPPPSGKEHKPIREMRLENERRRTAALPRPDPIL